MYKIVPIIFIFFFSLALNAQINPNLENRFRLAQSYEQIGQFDKAEIIYRELYNLQQYNYQYFEALNKVFLSQKKYNESILLLKEKIKLTPTDFNLYGLLGTTYYIKDEVQNAFDIWEKGIAINPTFYVGYRIIANYVIENRAYEKAIDILKRGKKISNDPIIFSIDLANIYASNMKFKEAAIEFCDLLETRPEQLQMIKSRMSNYLNRPGASEQTTEVLKELIDSKNRIEFYDLLAFVYQSAGNFKNAFAAVIESEKKFKGIGTNIFVFAQEAYRNRQYTWSAEAYNYILKNHSNSQFVSSAKIGYAKTLEADLDQKFFEKTETWKPYTKPIPSFVDEYKKIISAYGEFGNSFPDNSIKVEAQFRIAEIYRNRILDFKSADSCYIIVSQISPLSNYSVQSNIARGKIAIEQNNIDGAKNFLSLAKANPRIEPNELSETNYYLAKIEFWNGLFTNSIKLLQELSKNLSTDFANDALELSSLISATKKDSVNLLRYAKADLLAIQNKLKEAGTEFKTLSDNGNLFLINDFARIKFAELLIAQNDFSSAVKILEETSQNQKSGIFAEKSTFLLAQCYELGIKDIQKATQIYQKLLETFPNSLYFDRAREVLNGISK